MITNAANTAVDPRWGKLEREAKAEAIFATLQMVCGENIARGAWLDVGCGSGGIAATIALRVSSMIGVDPEPWERWRSFGEMHPNLSFHVGSYCGLGHIVGRGTIDVVVCNQVYEHVDDPAALLVAIHDVLRPGGVCYFAGPNLLWPIEPHVYWPFVHWLPRAFAQRVMRVLGSRRAAELDAYSTHYWRLCNWFRAAGLVPRNAIAARIEAEFAMRGKNWRLPSRLALILDALAPASPGFVFCLRRL